MLRTPSRRASFLAFALIVNSIWSDAVSSVRAQTVNRTLDDSDPAIVYSALTNTSGWFANSTNCAPCLKPDQQTIAWRSSWHFGMHIIPTSDADDENGDDDHDQDSGIAGRKRSWWQRDVLEERDSDGNPFETGKNDEDDPGFVDIAASFAFNFTGSAVYVFGILPLGVASANSTPTFVNLTWTIDGQQVQPGAYQHQGSPSADGFQAGQVLVSQTNLTEAPHTLNVTLGPDSVFMLDKIVYTVGNTSNSASAPAQASAQSAATSSGSRKHSITTFVAAVGGVVGMLFFAAIGIAVTLVRRRRKAALRDRMWAMEHDSDAGSINSSNGPSRAPSMRGPQPFVPRYFPNSVPTAPPPYVADAAADSHAEATLLSSPLNGAIDGLAGAHPPLEPAPLSLPALAHPTMMQTTTPPMPTRSPSGLQPLSSPRIMYSPPPLISLGSPELRPTSPNSVPMAVLSPVSASSPVEMSLAGSSSPRPASGELPPSYFESSAFPLAARGVIALQDDNFDYGLHGMNVPPPRSADVEISAPAASAPTTRPPTRPGAGVPTWLECVTTSPILSRLRVGRTGRHTPRGSDSLPDPQRAERDSLMEIGEDADEEGS